QLLTHAQHELLELGAAVMDHGPGQRLQHLGRHGYGPWRQQPLAARGLAQGARQRQASVAAHRCATRRVRMTSDIERSTPKTSSLGVLSSVRMNIARPSSETLESCMLLMFTPASPNTVPTRPTAPGLSKFVRTSMVPSGRISSA